MRLWLCAALAAGLLCSAACTPLQLRFDGFANVDFRLRGRIGARVDEESFSASFDWQQAGDRFAIEFWGLMGQGRTLLLGDGRRVRIVDARGQVVEAADDVDALMMRVLGWRAPIAALRDWVRGRIAPGPANRLAHDVHGRPTRFEQRGWTVELRGWRSAAVGEVPAKVIARKGATRITIIGKEWFGRVAVQTAR